MRIISGTHKSRRLTAPSNLPVRPTTDFAKEGLFNILRNRVSISDVKVIDLFAGTGNISYEFASRGCKIITAVDAHHGCIKFINKTSENLDFPIQTIKGDVLKFLQTTPITADIIFADPPYDFTVDDLADLVQTTFDRSLLLNEGFLIIEHTKHNDLSQIIGFQESRRYGGSVFSFFNKD